MSTDDLLRRARAWAGVVSMEPSRLLTQLADEVDRLRVERDEWAMQWRGADDMFGAMRDERDDLLAERDAARAALERGFEEAQCWIDDRAGRAILNVLEGES